MANDIKAQPWSEWMEGSLRELVDLEPQTIGIVFIRPDGSTGTHYFMADNRDRLIMCESIMLDYLDALIQVNADHLRELILGEEEEDDE